jgi:hypothetical protein
MIGSDDVLACFIAGNTFTWDDWFRLETMDDSFQPTIDMLLNVTIFIWYGAVCPWHEFTHNSVIPIYRLIFLGILVLLLRRLPIVYAMHWQIPQIEQKRQALFVGFFGPIGVSAIFYLYVSLEFLNKITVNGEIREDAQYLKEVMNVVIWFLCICSVVSSSPYIRHPPSNRHQVVHGLSIPMAKLGLFIPRTLSQALSTTRDQDEPEAFHIPESSDDLGVRIRRRIRSRDGGDTFPQRVVRIGRSIIPSSHGSSSTSRTTSVAPTPLTTVATAAQNEEQGNKRNQVSDEPSQAEMQRTIRFASNA